MNKPKTNTADTVTLWAAKFDYDNSVVTDSGQCIEREKTYKLVECENPYVFGWRTVINKADKQVFDTEAEAVEALIASVDAKIEKQKMILADLTQRRQNAAGMLTNLSKDSEQPSDDN